MESCKKKDERPFLWMFGSCVAAAVVIGASSVLVLLIMWFLSWPRADKLIVLYFIGSCVIICVANKLRPRQTVKRYQALVEVTVVDLDDNVPNQNLAYIAQEVDRQFVDSQEQIDLFHRYAHLTLGPYMSVEDLLRLDDYIDSYALQGCLSTECVPINPKKLKPVDLFHFGWNMAHYFDRPKQEVVPWLQSVFTRLRRLEPSYVKGKLYSPHIQHVTIPNVKDIAQYMAERERG